MYFTDDKKLQRFEREMKIVPNFERKEVWEYADSCNECKNYECKLESCMEAHCPYLKRKIRSNSIITRDLVETFLVDNPYIPFAHRVINYRDKQAVTEKDHYRHTDCRIQYPHIQIGTRSLSDHKHSPEKAKRTEGKVLIVDGRSHVGMENTKRRLKDMCGGEMIIESTPGEGTVATVILPKDGQKNEDTVS